MHAPQLGLASVVQTALIAAVGTAPADTTSLASFGDVLMEALQAGVDVAAIPSPDLAGPATDLNWPELTGASHPAPAELPASASMPISLAIPAPLPVPVSVPLPVAVPGTTIDKDTDEVPSPDLDESPVSAGLVVLAAPITPVARPDSAGGDDSELPASGKTLPAGQVPLQQPVQRRVNTGTFLHNETQVSAAPVPAAGPAEIGKPLPDRFGPTVDAQIAVAKTAAASTLRNPAKPLLANNSVPSVMLAESAPVQPPLAEAVAGIPVRSTHFVNLLGNQVLWQAQIGNHQAQIRLDPPELGPIEVRITQIDNETQLQFFVHHQGTRDQLEQALPRLRELFGQGGLQLGQVEVQQGRREWNSQQAQSDDSGFAKHPIKNDGNDEPVPHHAVLVGLIDDYA